MLLLPGADTWNDSKHQLLLKKPAHYLLLAFMGAICGATTALANAGLLNDRTH